MLGLFATTWRQSGKAHWTTPLPMELPIPGLASEVKYDDLKAPGLWAIVAEDGESLVAAVDRIRSIPLFYGLSVDNQQLFVSDRAEWVRERLDVKEVSSRARSEFLKTGYVVGDKTLFPGVHQLLAGQYLRAKATGGVVDLQVLDYFVFARKPPEGIGRRELVQGLASACDSSINRLVELSGNRRLIIPLSGGGDSRLIATLLSRKCPQKIVTFSYGDPSTGDANISRKVAQELGLPWHFVPYSLQNWSKWRDLPEMEHCVDLAHQYVSTPSLQDWPAVYELRKRGVIQPDDILVPGHAGDMPTGNMTVREFLPPVRETRLAQMIVNKHYVLWPDKILGIQNSANLESALASVPSGWNGDTDPASLISAADSWNWRERQSKYIANAVRVYEAFDLAWWLPLWDKEFTEYWTNVPLEFRLGRSFYREFVAATYFLAAGNTQSYHDVAQGIPLGAVGLVERVLPAKMSTALRRRVAIRLRKKSMARSYLGSEGWITPAIKEEFAGVGAGNNAFFALETLLYIAQGHEGMRPTFASHL